MRGRGGAKAFFISGAIILTVLLYLSPKKAMNPITQESRPTAAFDINELLLYQENSLEDNEKQMAATWKERIRQNPGQELHLHDSLAAFWDSKRAFALSGWYFEQKAAADHNEQSYLNAAYRYFDAYKNALDSVVRDEMVAGAIRNYKMVLDVSPNNLDVKTDLGVLYAEATAEPMKGIILLREVVAANPAHENAQFNLGILSVRSQQYAKAVERFDNVLRANPARHDALLLKAHTLKEMGDTDLAIQTFELFVSSSADSEAVAEAKQMIKKLGGSRNDNKTKDKDI